VRKLGLLDGEAVLVADLRAERTSELIPVLGPEPDPSWSLTDAAGHLHKPEVRDDRVRSYPTLATVVTDTYWCDDCRDEHDTTMQVCIGCGEVIHPGTRPARDIVVLGPVTVRAELLGGTWTEAERTLEVDGILFRGHTASAHWMGGELPRMGFEGWQV
jgi:hypothetical protein